MAYASTDNFCEIEAAGARAFIPFKNSITGAIGGIYEKAFHYFKLHREEFDARYHQRSNLESTFAMIKAKHGDSVRSKSNTAMQNEVLAKIVCHNTCCLISAMYELGISPEFARAVKTAVSPAQVAGLFRALVGWRDGTEPLRIPARYT